MAVFKIRPSIKNYEWGRLGKLSAVALLYKSEYQDFEIDDKMPYSEMWIGTHNSGPAIIPSLGNVKLMNWILNHPESLGKNITETFDISRGLPFLFKVLSVNKSLSIQAHPDKETAEKLYKEFPDRYPDDNHKPEMAIALTNFEALCGFRPLSEIKSFIQEIPQLREVIDRETINRFLKSERKEDFKSLFTSLMTCEAERFQPPLVQIVKCFKEGQFKNPICNSIGDVFLKTYEQYPGDIGCFCLFFLNYLKLNPGESIYLAANEPHAYLYGDCIECMACSDNVVRAGLTPKFRDVATLCDILTYCCKTSEENKFLPLDDPNDPFVKIYNPPVKEFAVDCLTINQTNGSYSLKVLQSASVLLVVKGNGLYKSKNVSLEFNVGSILYISSDCDVQLETFSDFLAFRAYCSA